MKTASKKYEGKVDLRGQQCEGKELSTPRIPRLGCSFNFQAILQNQKNPQKIQLKIIYLNSPIFS